MYACLYMSRPICLPIYMYIHMHSSPTFSDITAHHPTSYSIIQYKVLNGKRMFVECIQCRSDNFSHEETSHITHTIKLPSSWISLNSPTHTLNPKPQPCPQFRDSA